MLGAFSGVPARIKAGAPALVAAVMAVLLAFNIVDWSEGQVALATAEALFVLGFVFALISHFNKDTSAEPVAVGTTFGVLVMGTLALLTDWPIVHWTPEQVGVVTSLVLLVLGFFGITVARDKTTPWPKGYPYVDAPINPAGLQDGGWLPPANPAPPAEPPAPDA